MKFHRRKKGVNREKGRKEWGSQFLHKKRGGAYLLEGVWEEGTSQRKKSLVGPTHTTGIPEALEVERQRRGSRRWYSNTPIKEVWKVT